MFKNTREPAQEKQGWHRERYDEIIALGDPAKQVDRLCELNLSTQVRTVAMTSIVQAAWRRGKRLEVHGWIYSLTDGVLNDLGFGISDRRQSHEAFRIES